MMLLSMLAWSAVAWHGSFVEGFQTTPATPRIGVATTTIGNRRSGDSGSGSPSSASGPAALSAIEKKQESSADTTTSVRYEPVFDFSGPDRESVVAKFDRIDDAIMGGISTSSLRASPTEGYASWSGVCRLDGGGFCGTRTLPFKDGVPLKVGAERDGFYLTVRLASDNEPDRRVWKLTTRVENVQNTELVYQTDFGIPEQAPQEDEGDGRDFGAEWKTIKVPFKDFVQVRGPRLVPDGPDLDVTKGLYQVGMTMSKFRIAANATELEDFRPGYFELQIRDIGLYTEATEAVAVSNGIDAPLTVTKEEANKNRPLAFKILFPIAKLFFSEQRNRRKSATRILKERWGLGRWGAARFGFRRRAASKGTAVALAQSLVEAVATTSRLVAFWTLKIAFFYPLVALRRTFMLLKRKLPQTPKPQSE